jgi:hypothetical protein
VSKSGDDKSGKSQGHGDRVRRVMANKEGERSWRPISVRTKKITPSNGDIKGGEGVANRVRQVLANKTKGRGHGDR